MRIICSAFLLSQFQKSSSRYYYSQVHIYPLTETTPLCLPERFDKTFISQHCRIFQTPFYSQSNNNEDKLVRKLRSICSPRRAELFYEKVLMNNTSHNNKELDVDHDDESHVRMKHQTRQEIQSALYDYALNHLLGLSNSKQTSGRIPFLLDLGCGCQSNVISHYASFASPSSSSSVSSMSNNPTFIPICIDLFNTELPFPSRDDNSRRTPTSEVIQLLNCNLIRQYTSQSNQIIPLKDNSIDYIISISFFQWLFIQPYSLLSWKSIDFLLYEIVRLLDPRHGQCVLQFYPTNQLDVKNICQSISRTIPKLIGCQLVCRPVVNRGMKIFVYLTPER
ncbi:unnamed protein product [Trichobilharzia szidati]|nr:unnamed protein product [Trichobilharzia szidati]